MFIIHPNIKVNVIIKDETLWLTQKAMAELFDVNIQAITKHLKNIYEEGELEKEATCSKMEQVQQEGGRLVKRNVEFYNIVVWKKVKASVSKCWL